MKYPLEDLLKIKIHRFEKAVKLFEEKTDKFLKEKEKLFKLTQERDKILKHKNDKLNQLREYLDRGEKTDKILKTKSYLKIVKEKLKMHQEQVDSQQIILNKAEDELEQAKKNLFEKKKDVEKLNIHKTEWKKEIQKLEKKIESITLNEIGTSQFIIRKKEKQ
ncbi:MAG: hypothetical protein AMS24_00260 [Chlamydiae bacterium SM23_39]|nr:MAG: hypothetical protein AMS24_00260 [Chlamydiae bacterium SM23_39]